MQHSTKPFFTSLDDAFVFADSLASNIVEIAKNYRTEYDALEAQKTLIGNLMWEYNFHPYDIAYTQGRFEDAAVWRLVE